jgi:hypothetical protein
MDNRVCWHGRARSNPAGPSESEIVERVAQFHGAAGCLAIASYRIGARALNLDVIHNTPFEVQWSCIADGIQAPTGVGASKLNLHPLEARRVLEARRDKLETVVRERCSGKILSCRLEATGQKGKP